MLLPRNERGPLQAICNDGHCHCEEISMREFENKFGKPSGIGHVIIELIDDPMCIFGSPSNSVLGHKDPTNQWWWWWWWCWCWCCRRCCINLTWLSQVPWLWLSVVKVRKTIYYCVGGTFGWTYLKSKWHDFTIPIRCIQLRCISSYIHSFIFFWEFSLLQNSFK